MSRDAYHKKPVTNWRHEAILDALSDGRVWSVQDLARGLNVVERTLRRDLVELRELGYRIDGSPGAGGGVMLRKSSG